MKKLFAQYQKRKTIKALDSLSDSVLADIGINHRSQIEAFVYGH